MSSIQLNILLLSLGGLQGILLFVLLLKKRRSLPGYYFLAAYLGVMLLQVMMKIASKAWLMQNLDPVYQLSYQLPFLYGPLVYLFVGRFTGYRSARIRDIFHFLPALIVIGILWFWPPYLKLPGIFNVFFNYSWSAPLQVISILAYHFGALMFLDQYSGKSGSYINPHSLARMKWVKQFTMVSMMVCSVVAIVICLMYFNNPAWKHVRFGFVALTAFIYWISYKALSQPELFSVVRGNAQLNLSSPAPVLTVHLPTKKYSNSGLSTQELNNIIAGLSMKMVDEKPYLDPQLTIDQLAQSVGCTRHHLSQAINEQLDQSFYDYINHYRVEAARALLNDPARASHKIASIAFDSGFNSISTFNEVFKKIAGITPSQFRKQAEEERLKRHRV